MQRKRSRVLINKVASRPDGRRSAWLALGRMALALLAAGAFMVAGVAEASESDESHGNEKWVGTWSNALHQPDLGVPGLANAGFNNQTLRQIVHISVGGPRVRVRLSTFGASGVVISAAHIALRATAASIVPGSDRRLTFGGTPSIAIPAGAPDDQRQALQQRAQHVHDLAVSKAGAPNFAELAAQSPAAVSPPRTVATNGAASH